MTIPLRTTFCLVSVYGGYINVGSTFVRAGVHRAVVAEGVEAELAVVRTHPALADAAERQVRVG